MAILVTGGAGYIGSHTCVELGWKAERGIEEMCADSWRWQSGNPDGYNS